eukprot:2368728-Rhodomonas_salina.1
MACALRLLMATEHGGLRLRVCGWHWGSSTDDEALMMALGEQAQLRALHVLRSVPAVGAEKDRSEMPILQ